MDTIINMASHHCNILKLCDSNSGVNICPFKAYATCLCNWAFFTRSKLENVDCSNNEALLFSKYIYQMCIVHQPLQSIKLPGWEKCSHGKLIHHLCFGSWWFNENYTVLHRFLNLSCNRVSPV